ncbi:MAG: hypothetical protein AB1480_11945 [Nitrospirota bacterium]
MSIEKNKIGIILIALLVCVFMSVSICYAGKVKVVEGLIEDVTSDYIKVRGGYYNISDVPLLDSSGKNVSKDRLRTGRKVEIFFQGDRITSILIHEYMVE